MSPAKGDNSLKNYHHQRDHGEACRRVLYQQELAIKVIIPKKLAIMAILQCMSETLVGCVNNLARAPSQLGGSQEARTDSALAKASPGDFYPLLPPGCEGSPIGIQNHCQACLADWQ